MNNRILLLVWSVKIKQFSWFFSICKMYFDFKSHKSPLLCNAFSSGLKWERDISDEMKVFGRLSLSASEFMLSP